jgi:lysophospholipase L1-like esterase
MTLVGLAAICSAAPARELKADEKLEPSQSIAHVVRKIILVGDSTVSVRSGWGGAVCDLHVNSRIACVDLAREGRSTHSYRAEGSWKIALAEMKAGHAYAATYVLIQFGHNDQPGKPGRSSDLATELPANLRSYVMEARAAGAVPVLVTPLTRRIFKSGVLQDTLEPWAAAIRKTASEMGVPLIDLHARSKAAVQALGPVGSTKLAQLPPAPDVLEVARADGNVGAPVPVVPAVMPPTPTPTPQTPGAPGPTGKLVFDTTHLGEQGADFFASQIAEELARIFPDLRSDLVL